MAGDGITHFQESIMDEILLLLFGWYSGQSMISQIRPLSDGKIFILEKYPADPAYVYDGDQCSQNVIIRNICHAMEGLSRSFNPGWRYSCLFGAPPVIVLVGGRSYAPAYNYASMPLKLST